MVTQNQDPKKAFEQYKPYITKCLVDKCRISYATVESLGDGWLKTYEYSVDCEHFLIDKSQDFLFTVLCSQDCKFLGAVARHMATHLAEYAVRKYNLSNRKEKRNAILEETNYLFDAIYTESKYIQKLKYQKLKNELFYGATTEIHPTIISDQKAKHMASECARNARNLHRQVMGEFADARTYKKGC